MFKTLSLLCTLAPALAAEYAVIVAGSNTYSNYRHQADACHAYQVLKDNGVPDSNIIVMQYDDLANNRENPYPGQIFNKPTDSGTPGVDVYADCPKDYTGRDVTPDNFLAILTGDASKVKGGNGRVLQTTETDDVFINFADHGGTGLIAFPSKYLYAKDLNAALQTMADKKMYRKLVFYLEACESGSMFDGLLPNNIEIYATTAANPEESSWGTYCPPEDMVNGKSLDTCLGDLYSITWMENTDSMGTSQSLDTQWKSILQLTTKSHPQQYGDLTWTSEAIGNFMGNGSSKFQTKPPVQINPKNPSAGTVRSRDIPMHLAYYKYLRAEPTDSFTARKALAAELVEHVTQRVEAEQFFMDLASKFANSNAINDAESLFSAPATNVATCGDCCKEAVEHYDRACAGFNDFSLQYVRVLHNICGRLAGNDVHHNVLLRTMDDHC